MRSWSNDGRSFRHASFLSIWQTAIYPAGSFVLIAALVGAGYLLHLVIPGKMSLSSNDVAILLNVIVGPYLLGFLLIKAARFVMKLGRSVLGIGAVLFAFGYGFLMAATFIS